MTPAYGIISSDNLFAMNFRGIWWREVFRVLTLVTAKETAVNDRGKIEFHFLKGLVLSMVFSYLRKVSCS